MSAPPQARPSVPISEPQAEYLEGLRKRHGISVADLTGIAGKPIAELDRAEASALIQRLSCQKSEAFTATLQREALLARGQVDMFAAGEVDERGPPPPRRIAGAVWPDTARRGRPRRFRYQRGAR